MSVTLKPIANCSMGCIGCYETRIFQANGNSPEPYDLNAIIASMLRIPGPVSLHGGEILLMPLPDLRTLIEAAAKDNRQISMQSGLSLLNDRHVDLLKEFNVSVGVSLNGPTELNRDRRAVPHTRSLPVLEANQATDLTTERVYQNVVKLRRAGISVSIICVLSKTNAGDKDKLKRLAQWAHGLGEAGIWHVRFNPLHDDYSDGADIELTEQEAADAYRFLAALTTRDSRRMWLPFREYIDNIWGLGCQPCWHGGCDVYQTAAVHAVFGDGSEGNCLRTAKDGTAYLRDSQTFDMRSQILQQVPTDQNGCKGCKHWRVCKGGCPAEGVDGDWRNRSRFCQMYYQTYDFLIDKMRGMIPNFTPVQDWTTNDEASLMQSTSSRRPLVSPINPMDQNWSQTPSSWRNDARNQK